MKTGCCEWLLRMILRDTAEYVEVFCTREGKEGLNMSAVYIHTLSQRPLGLM